MCEEYLSRSLVGHHYTHFPVNGRIYRSNEELDEATEYFMEMHNRIMEEQRELLLQLEPTDDEKEEMHAQIYPITTQFSSESQFTSPLSTTDSLHESSLEEMLANFIKTQAETNKELMNQLTQMETEHEESFWSMEDKLIKLEAEIINPPITISNPDLQPLLVNKSEREEDEVQDQNYPIFAQPPPELYSLPIPHLEHSIITKPIPPSSSPINPQPANQTISRNESIESFFEDDLRALFNEDTLDVTKLDENGLELELVDELEEIIPIMRIDPDDSDDDEFWDLMKVDTLEITEPGGGIEKINVDFELIKLLRIDTNEDHRSEKSHEKSPPLPETIYPQEKSSLNMVINDPFWKQLENKTISPATKTNLLEHATIKSESFIDSWVDFKFFKNQKNKFLYFFFTTRDVNEWLTLLIRGTFSTDFTQRPISVGEVKPR